MNTQNQFVCLFFRVEVGGLFDSKKVAANDKTTFTMRGQLHLPVHVIFLLCYCPVILGIIALMDSCLRGSCHSGSYPQLIVSAVVVLGVVVLYPPFTKSSLTPSSWI